MSDENERQHRRILVKRLSQLLDEQVETNEKLQDIMDVLRKHLPATQGDAIEDALRLDASALIEAALQCVRAKRAEEGPV